MLKMNVEEKSNVLLVVARLIFYGTALTASLFFIIAFPLFGILTQQQTDIIRLPVLVSALLGDFIVFIILEVFFRKLQTAANIENVEERIYRLASEKRRLILAYFPLVYAVVLTAALLAVIALLLEGVPVLTIIIGATLASVAYILSLHLPAFFLINYLLDLFVAKNVNKSFQHGNWAQISLKSVNNLNTLSMFQRQVLVGIISPVMLFILVISTLVNVQTLTIFNVLGLGLLFLLYLIASAFFIYQSNNALKEFVKGLKNISLAQTNIFIPISFISLDDIAQATAFYNNIVLKLQKTIDVQIQAANTLNELVRDFRQQFADLNDLANNISQSSSTFASAMQDSMDMAETVITELNKLQNSLSTFSDKISVLTKSIEEVAEQVQVLSFNARLEAYRSSEGSTFAVIAEKVYDFSKSVEKSKEDIATLLNEFKNQIIAETNSIMNTVTTVTERLSQVSSQTEEVNASIEEETATIEELYAQTENLVEIAEKLNEISQLFVKK